MARRLCTVAGFYRYAEEEGLVPVSPAAHVRRPRLDCESHAAGLDRNEVGALLVAAGLGSPAEHALISLLALNGLRVSEAIGADIEALELERGHRTLTVLRKGGKVVTVPLAPRTARAVDLAIGERPDRAHLLGADGRRFDRHIAGRVVRRVGRRAGVNKPIGPHTLRRAFIKWPPWTQECRSVMSRRPQATPTRGRQCATTEPGSPLTATLLTSSPRTSPAPVVRNNRCSGRLSAKTDAQVALSSVRGIAEYVPTPNWSRAVDGGRIVARYGSIWPELTVRLLQPKGRSARCSVR